jgi:hypothetical protein
MQFQRYEIREIARAPWAEDVFIGIVAFQFVTGIGPADLGHEISIKIRVRHDATSTFESLERKLFEEAAGLLDHASRFVATETFESLRRSVLAGERKRMAELDRNLQDVKDYDQED